MEKDDAESSVFKKCTEANYMSLFHLLATSNTYSEGSKAEVDEERLFMG
jgi:hypothetical protein